MTIDRGQYRFTVKEYAGGALFLAAEPAGDRLKHLSGDLSFDLAPDTSYGGTIACGVAQSSHCLNHIDGLRLLRPVLAP